MSIRDELRAELKDAMVSRDQARTAVIRQIEAEISLARSSPGFSGDLDDALYEQTIAAYVKKMDKARQEYLGAGDRGADQADKLAYEIDYLQRWLPETMGEDETRQLVRETRQLVRTAISDLGADDPKMAGRVVGHVMKTGPDGLDGALVNRLVREELGA